jgi:hypothetical protein
MGEDELETAGCVDVEPGRQGTGKILAETCAHGRVETARTWTSAALGAVKDGGEAEMQRPEARMLEWQLGVEELEQATTATRARTWQS